MIIECPKCKSRYKVSDEKLAAKSGPVKLKCKKCGFTITVEKQHDEQSQWYVADKGQRKGPFSDQELLDQAREGRINEVSFVWTKGFTNWQRAGDVDLFKAVFGPQAEDEGEETQLLDSRAIQRLTGEFSTEVDDKEKAGEDGLVWQRHETSVLFSLDDYSPGMRTITRGQAVVDLGEEEPQEILMDASGNDDSEAGGMDVISLDEQDVANVKKVLDASQKRRTTMYITIGAIAAIAIVLVAVLFMSGRSKKQTNVKENVSTHVKPQKKVPKKSLKPVQQKKPVVVKKQAPDAVIAKDVQVRPEKAAVKKKAVPIRKRVSRKARPKRRRGKSAKLKKKTSRKTAAVKVKRPKKIGGSAQSILNSLKIGKKKQEKNGVTPGNYSNLPRTLPTAVVNQVMRRVRPRVKRCLDKAGIDNEGQLVIMSRLKIAGKGYVQSVKLSGHVGAARSCIVGVLKSLRFSRFRDTTMPISYPYVF